MTEHRHNKSRDAVAVTEVIMTRPYLRPPTTRGLSIHKTAVHSKMQLDAPLTIDRMEVIVVARLFTLSAAAADLLRVWGLMP